MYGIVRIDDGTADARIGLDWIGLCCVILYSFPLDCILFFSIALHCTSRLSVALFSPLIVSPPPPLALFPFFFFRRSRLASHVEVEQGLKGLIFSVAEIRNCDIL